MATKVVKKRTIWTESEKVTLQNIGMNIAGEKVIFILHTLYNVYCRPLII